MHLSYSIEGMLYWAKWLMFIWYSFSETQLSLFQSLQVCFQQHQLNLDTKGSALLVSSCFLTHQRWRKLWIIRYWWKCYSEYGFYHSLSNTIISRVDHFFWLIVAYLVDINMHFLYIERQGIFSKMIYKCSAHAPGSPSAPKFIIFSSNWFLAPHSP